ncbi:hypothetical protein ES703_102011 [subsurface metagenome]
MKLGSIGKVLSSGFGDRVLTGIFIGLLDGVTPAIAYEYIKDDLELGHWIKEDDWQKFRRMAKNANVGNITSGDIIEELRKSKLDILSVIINTPNGRSWLDNQVTKIKEKLELE